MQRGRKHIFVAVAAIGGLVLLSAYLVARLKAPHLPYEGSKREDWPGGKEHAIEAHDWHRSGQRDSIFC